MGRFSSGAEIDLQFNTGSAPLEAAPIATVMTALILHLSIGTPKLSPHAQFLSFRIPLLIFDDPYITPTRRGHPDGGQVPPSPFCAAVTETAGCL
jgi:hypothetical protein